MVLRAEAEIFQGNTINGITRPALMSCTEVISGVRFDAIVKFRASVRNREFSLISEIICSQFAAELGLNVPSPFLVNVSQEVVDATPAAAFDNPTYKDIMRRSIGVNFASAFTGPAFKTVPEEVKLPETLKATASEIFAFDVIVRNLDRKRDNPNMLWDGTTLVLIDHEAAFQGVLAGDWNLRNFDLDRFYDHVLFSAIDRDSTNFDRLTRSLGDINLSRLQEFAAHVPDEWDSGGDSQKVVDYLHWVILNREEICALVLERIA